MSQPSWKKLVESLKADEFESTYLDRLDRRLTIETERASLEREIIEEMGFALRKSSDKISPELCLDDCPRDNAPWSPAKNLR